MRDQEKTSTLRTLLIARHPCGTWIKALTVASFRTWRVSRPSIAQDPAINSNRNQHAPYLSKMAEREGLSACGGPGMVGIFNIVRLAFGSTHTPVTSPIHGLGPPGRLRRSRFAVLQNGRTLRFPTSQPTASYEKWRRERDSNPRYTINVHTISSRAPSAARASLRQSTSWCMQQVQSHLSPSAQRTLR